VQGIKAHFPLLTLGKGNPITFHSFINWLKLLKVDCDSGRAGLLGVVDIRFVLDYHGLCVLRNGFAFVFPLGWITRDVVNGGKVESFITLGLITELYIENSKVSIDDQLGIICFRGSIVAHFYGFNELLGNRVENTHSFCFIEATLSHKIVIVISCNVFDPRFSANKVLSKLSILLIKNFR